MQKSEVSGFILKSEFLVWFLLEIFCANHVHVILCVHMPKSEVSVSCWNLNLQFDYFWRFFVQKSLARNLCVHMQKSEVSVFMLKSELLVLSLLEIFGQKACARNVTRTYTQIRFQFQFFCVLRSWNNVHIIDIIFTIWKQNMWENFWLKSDSFLFWVTHNSWFLLKILFQVILNNFTISKTQIWSFSFVGFGDLCFSCHVHMIMMWCVRSQNKTCGKTFWLKSSLRNS